MNPARLYMKLNDGGLAFGMRRPGHKRRLPDVSLATTLAGLLENTITHCLSPQEVHLRGGRICLAGVSHQQFLGRSQRRGWARSFRELGRMLRRAAARLEGQPEPTLRIRETLADGTVAGPVRALVQPLRLERS
ncbi:hypothetical protein ACFL6C_11025 [Myxococcota bacterium]